MLSLDLVEQIDLDLDEMDPIVCESQHESHEGIPAHPANWYCITDCGAPVIALCDRRREMALEDDGVVCDPGCGRAHTWTYLGWQRIEGQ